MLRGIYAHMVSLREHEERMGSRNYKRAIAWFNRWLAGADLAVRPDLGRIHCPTLVTQGMHDEFVGPDHAEGIARAIPGAALWLIPNAAHGIPRLDGDAFESRVLAFVAQH